MVVAWPLKPSFGPAVRDGDFQLLDGAVPPRARACLRLAGIASIPRAWRELGPRNYPIPHSGTKTRLEPPAAHRKPGRR
jgi:hypothetical protein